MPKQGPQRRARFDVVLNWSLVAFQAVLFLGIGLWPTSWGPALPAVREVGGVLFLVGSVGMVLTARTLGRALTPVPEPNGAGLRTDGLFRWVRHPMYTAVLIVTGGVGLARGSAVVWFFVVVLAVFFEVKTRREEAYLSREYEGYAAYAAATGKFIPGVAKRRMRG